AREIERASLAPFRVGISMGEMTPIAGAGGLASFSWGAPLVTAIALARIARPGEVLIDPEVRAVGDGEVATSGARVGEDAASGMRGLIVDPEQHARRGATEIRALVRPALVGNQAGLDRLLSSQASLGLVRADPGLGGTRMLAEIEARLAPARCLYLSGA